MSDLSDSMAQSWRLIPYWDGPGHIQMTMDDWLLRQFVQGLGKPTLRFYGWQPAAISLGYFQKSYPEHWPTLTWEDQLLSIVRRPSGGRAVLHQGSLTYAVICDQGQGKRWQAYERICQFLIAGWQQLGIPLQYGTAQRGYIHNASCFNTATAADLVALDGSKLIGSAQRQCGHAILQHGSMVLNSDRLLFEQVFQQLAPWKKTLSDRLGEISLPEILTVLTEKACQCFDINLITQPLTPEEWQSIYQHQNRLELPPSKSSYL